MIKIINDDCLNVFKTIQEKSVDIIVTSPPYNLKVNYSSYKDDLPYQDYLNWIKSVFTEAKKILKDDGSLFLNIGCNTTSQWLFTDIPNQLRDVFCLQNTIIWAKNISLNGTSYGHFKPITSKRYLNNIFEYIFHFTPTGNTTLDRKAIGVPYVDKYNVNRWDGGEDLRCAGNIWFIPYETVTPKGVAGINLSSQKFNHPAGFPTELPKRCIKLHGVKENMTVLDPFLGAGTTLVACQELGVNGIGIELDANYCDIAQKRLNL